MKNEHFLGSFQMDSSFTDSDMPESHSEDSTALSQDVTNKLNASETPTEYYTPNESLRTERNSGFLEKLSRVINDPQTELSEYTSALENTKSSVTTEAQTKNESFKSALSQEHSNSPDLSLVNNRNNAEDSCLNFLEVAAGHSTTCDIANFHQSLVENTVSLSDDEIVIANELDYSDSEVNLHEELEYKDRHTLIQKKMLSPTAEEIFVISDDEESLLSNTSVVSDEVGCKTFLIKKEISYQNDMYDEKCDIMKVEEGNVLGNVSNRKGNCGVSYEENQHEDKSTCNSGKSGAESQSQSEEKPVLNASSITIPEIDLTQFDDSLSQIDSPRSVSPIDSPQFDDTLEEMNRLLNQGLDYTMSEDDSIIEGTPVRRGPEPRGIKTEPTCNIISGSFLQKQSDHTFLRSKEKRNKIPVRKFQQSVTPDSGQHKTYTSIKSSPNTNFKVPITPVRTKHANPTPPKSSSSHLKNIVSPVALYIKNSPNVPLKQNVPQRELPKIVTTKIVKPSSKENYPQLPEIVYKPAKKQITSKEKEITLPPSFKKLNIKEPIIVKHEGRINNNMNNSQVNRKLLQSDITNNSIDASVLNNSNDISVLTNKQAYIK